MQKVLLAISLVFIGVDSYAAELNIPNVLKNGDASNGSSLVATCAACHGNDGNSINTDWPSLAGQNQKYLYDQLVYFVNGERENALMTAVIPYLKNLSSDELLDIAAFYAESSASVGQADSDIDLLALGESLYRAGDLSRGIPACTACHSLYGEGNIQAGFPKISGQQKGYLISTLKEYRSQIRNAGNYALVMQAASANLKDDDIEALANYMHGLYRK
ncbi:MAG: c-type cytochrome [Gammaproteobacteria bacterium]|nr:MAG: cytochrome c4 [Gammaproteobacteria bacterium TMED104]|tara:strand:+ start:13 stop:666 length:654 start_codon:yes stop_codon:yes gene_type:complete